MTDKTEAQPEALRLAEQLLEQAVRQIQTAPSFPSPPTAPFLFLQLSEKDAND